MFFDFVGCDDGDGFRCWCTLEVLCPVCLLSNMMKKAEDGRFKLCIDFNKDFFTEKLTWIISDVFFWWLYESVFASVAPLLLDDLLEKKKKHGPNLHIFPFIIFLYLVCCRFLDLYTFFLVIEIVCLNFLSLAAIGFWDASVCWQKKNIMLI